MTKHIKNIHRNEADDEEADDVDDDEEQFLKIEKNHEGKVTTDQTGHLFIWEFFRHVSGILIT